MTARWIDPIDLVSRTDHPFMGANVVIHTDGPTPNAATSEVRSSGAQRSADENADAVGRGAERQSGSIPDPSAIRHAGHEYSSQPCMAAVDEPDATVKEVIHLMEMGSVLCRSPECRSDPWTWPVGHTWVKRADAGCVTCPECLKVLKPEGEYDGLVG